MEKSQNKVEFQFKNENSKNALSVKMHKSPKWLISSSNTNTNTNMTVTVAASDQVIERAYKLYKKN